MVCRHLFGWLEVFAQPFTKAVSEAERAGFLEEVRRALQPRLQKIDGTWFADYVRLRFKAVKPQRTPSE
jgi:hypothetical protein